MAEETAADRHAERLATLAAMARPVQHEINNLLTVVFANLELLKRTAAEGGPQRQLDRIQQATKRLEDSTRSILTLMRRPVPEPIVAAPLELMRVLAPLLQLLLPRAGALKLTLPESEPWKVRLDRAAFDEAMLALAREAAIVMSRGSELALALTQQEAEVSLHITWPEGAVGPDAGLAAKLVALGAEKLSEGRLLLRWQRETG